MIGSGHKLSNATITSSSPYSWTWRRILWMEFVHWRMGLLLHLLCIRLLALLYIVDKPTVVTITLLSESASPVVWRAAASGYALMIVRYDRALLANYRIILSSPIFV